MSMLKPLAAILAASSMLAFTVPSKAASTDPDYRQLLVSGYWTTFYTKTHEGHPLCGMRSSYRYSDSNAPDGSLMVKFIKGDKHLLVHAFKNSWRIPHGVKIPIYMTFDNSQPFTAEATGMARNGLNYVEFGIASEFSLDFFKLFAAATKMTLGFTEGSEPPWTANMTGSREAIGSFARCITAISDNGTSSTQPYGNGGATQPFGKTPSQPYGKPAPQPPRPAVKRDDGSV
jgi:hypothetical protein